MTRGAIYLDHNASAPLLPEARQALLAALDLTGNPSSVHGHGRALRNLVEAARAQIATAAGAERSQVVFTGSATEAIAQAVVAGARHLAADAILVSAGEHAAVLRAAEATGLPVKRIGLDEDGVIRLEEIAQAVKAADSVGMRLLVCVHLVNNETGVVQPVEAIEAVVGPTPHFLFVDAAQAFGKLPLEFAARATDMMALSGHKIGAPAGIGALLMKGHADAVRLIPGGGAGNWTARRHGSGVAAGGLRCRSDGISGTVPCGGGVEPVAAVRDGTAGAGARCGGVWANGPAARQCEQFRGAGPEERCGHDGAGSGRDFGLLRLGLFVGQGWSQPRAGGDGRAGAVERRRVAGEFWMELDVSRRRGLSRRFG